MNKRIRQLITVCALIAFSVNASIANGFMPAAVASGFPVQLCPDGFGPGFVQKNKPQVLHSQAHHGAHHDSHHDAATNDDEHADHKSFSDGECTFAGSALGNVAPLSAIVTEYRAAASPIERHSTWHPSSTSHPAFLARAPPAHLL